MPIDCPLDLFPGSSEHILRCIMKLFRVFLLTTFFLHTFFPLLAQAQQDKTPATKPPASAPIPRLTIEVTGGDANKPIENASVYVKTIEQHLIKDKKSEINVKTNQGGIAHIPQSPTGRVLIQVIADGWKTYGHWHDITDQQQVIKVHLDRPPKWY
jgi:hypothetical protein